jgi:chemotaxis protein methyltransferase CheR
MIQLNHPSGVNPILYADYLDAHPEEYKVLNGMCRINVTMFYRDKDVFDYICAEVYPVVCKLAGSSVAKCWCAGCSSGEEPYTVQIGWHVSALEGKVSGRMQTVGTDACPKVVQKCRAGEYRTTVENVSDDFPSIAELPEGWLEAAFDSVPGTSRYVVNAQVKGDTSFYAQDIRTQKPEGMFHLILCRNAMFMYFDIDSQTQMAAMFAQKLVMGGIFVIGITEAIPPGIDNFECLHKRLGIYKRIK